MTNDKHWLEEALEKSGLDKFGFDEVEYYQKLEEEKRKYQQDYDDNFEENDEDETDLDFDIDDDLDEDEKEFIEDDIEINGEVEFNLSNFEKTEFGAVTNKLPIPKDILNNRYVNEFGEFDIELLVLDYFPRYRKNFEYDEDTIFDIWYNLAEKKRITEYIDLYLWLLKNIDFETIDKMYDFNNKKKPVRWSEMICLEPLQIILEDCSIATTKKVIEVMKTDWVYQKIVKESKWQNGFENNFEDILTALANAKEYEFEKQLYYDAVKYQQVMSNEKILIHFWKQRAEFMDSKIQLDYYNEEIKKLGEHSDKILKTIEKRKKLYHL